MKEHPIIFNGEMVRAILEGRKTQTRRVLSMTGTDKFLRMENDRAIFTDNILDIFTQNPNSHLLPIKCPYGQPGDHLWVRETWGKCVFPETETSLARIKILYRADGETQYDIGCWKPSIHMPRWVSRITLEIVDVRVERLQQITEKDAEAEGIKGYTDNLGSRHSNPTMIYPAFPEKDGGFLTATQAFEALWDSINSKRGFGWEVNPWVWVIEFKKLPMT